MKKKRQAKKSKALTKEDCMNVDCESITAKMRCLGCRRTWYCSSKCQQADWQRHKDRCRIWTAELKLANRGWDDTEGKDAEEEDDCPKKTW